MHIFTLISSLSLFMFGDDAFSATLCDSKKAENKNQ